MAHELAISLSQLQHDALGLPLSPSLERLRSLGGPVPHPHPHPHPTPHHALQHAHHHPAAATFGAPTLGVCTSPPTRGPPRASYAQLGASQPSGLHPSFTAALGLHPSFTQSDVGGAPHPHPHPTPHPHPHPTPHPAFFGGATTLLDSQPPPDCEPASAASAALPSRHPSETLLEERLLIAELRLAEQSMDECLLMRRGRADAQRLHDVLTSRSTSLAKQLALPLRPFHRLPSPPTAFHHLAPPYATFH